jgi:hypothetical protein
MARSKFCAVKVVVVIIAFAYGFIANWYNLWDSAVVYCHLVNAAILLINGLASHKGGDIIVKCAFFIALVGIGLFTIGFGVEIRIENGCIIFVVFISGMCSARLAVNFNKLLYISNDSVHNITINRALDYAAEVLVFLIGVVFARLGTFSGRLAAIFGLMTGFTIIMTFV